MNTNLKHISGVLIFLSSCGSGGVSSGSLGIAPSISLNIEPQSITTYSSTSISWSSTNVETCIASGDWEGKQSLNGSKSFYYAAPKQKTFVLTCSGEDGEVTASVNLNVSDMKILNVPERISLYSED